MTDTEAGEAAAGAAASGVAFAAVYRAHFSDLLGYLVRRLRSRPSAEDLAQEAYLRLALSARRGHAIDNPRAFLFTVAANLARNHVRDEMRRLSALEGQALVGRFAIESRTPEQHLLGADALRRMEHAVRALPPRAREVFALSRFEGLSNREIAARLDISTTAVEKSLRRAFAALVAASADDAG